MTILGPRTFLAWLAIACFVLRSPARAETLEPVEPAAPPIVRTPLSWKDPILVLPSRWARTRVFAAAGGRIGSFTLEGNGTGAAIAFHLDLGVRRDRWLAFGSYDALGVTTGLAHRLGVAARYSLSRFAENDVGLDVWTEAGVGVEHVRWDAGGTLTRPDLALGIGATLLYLDRVRHTGVTAGLRITIAPRDVSAPAHAPSCGGPCDTATPPASFDRSFLFDITVPFGT